MVLESLTNPFKAEAHPAWLIPIGIGYALLGLTLAKYFFPRQASIVMIFFITAAAIPLLYNIIRYEEDKDYRDLDEKILIKEHGKAVLAYFMLFVGITAGLTLAFMFIPDSWISDTFASQIATLQEINPNKKITGGVTGHATGFDFFTNIFLNNFKVLLFSVLFSFMYGAGAIFILTWNASVIALAIGDKVRSAAAALAQASGLPTMAAYFSLESVWNSFQVVVLRYGIHGSLEMIAYMVAGLAGGIISVAAIRHHFSSKQFEHIVIDSADLLLIAIAILFVAAAWETWITPVLAIAVY